ncbi:peptidase S28 [Xylaria nigripes]|nr:peptidase S28 [Xylaria nigripes]
MRSTRIVGALSLLVAAQLSPAAAGSNQMMMRSRPSHMKDKEMSDHHRQIHQDNAQTIMGMGTFDQLIDHKNPGKGTFKQRYWWNAEFYEGDGPIFLFSPGESSASRYGGYLENTTLPGYYAQQFRGATIILEHRYFGDSRPVNTFTAETMQDLNVPNAISDLTYFAKNINLQFCEENACNSDDNPWVLMGGSYSGALTAWTSQLEPGVFHAYHASSAVVEAIYDFWEYFSPIEGALPESCKTNVKAVIQQVDKILESQVEDDVSALKDRFGLSALNDADFADVLSWPLTEWQSNKTAVLDFCDHLERVADGSTHLDSYGSYVNETSGCGKDGVNCDTYNPNIQWNTPNEIADVYNRAWMWFLCNEPFGWWQVGPPQSDGNNIISSALRPEHRQRQCQLIFPETGGFVVGSERGLTAELLNKWTNGWDASYQRVLFVNGQFDPWRSATIASDTRPNGPIANSETIPSLIVGNGVHVPEFMIDDNNPDTAPVIKEAVEIMGGWLKEWVKPSST